MKSLIVQHVSCEGPGLLADALLADGWELDIRCMDAREAVLPATLDGYSALVVLGGPMGAYEEEKYPYLYRVQELIRHSIEEMIPVAGICLGAQLIARTLGAPVMSNRVKEIGWYPLHLTPAGKAALLFAGLPPDLHVFQWHGDTFALPEGAVLLAQGETCKNQAFVYQNCAWALQFHLEVTPEMVAHWASIYEDELAAFGGPWAKEVLVEKTLWYWNTGKPARERFLNNLCAVLRGSRV